MTMEEKQGRDLIDTLNRVYVNTAFNFEVVIEDFEGMYQIASIYKYDRRFLELHYKTKKDTDYTYSYEDSLKATFVSIAQVRFTNHIKEAKGHSIRKAAELMLAMEVGLPKPN